MATKKTAVSHTIASWDALDSAGYGLGYQPALREPLEAETPPPIPERSTMRAVGDLATQFGSGVASGVRMMSDVFGADNRVSQGLRSVEEALQSLQSAAAQHDQQKVAAIMQEAEGKGWGEQIALGLKAAMVAPGAMMAQSLGTAVPTLATALIPGAGPAAVAARMGAGATVGAAQGAGNIKGVIYEDVKRELAKANPGMSPQEIEARAVEAQSYGGENAKQIALGGALGVAAGTTGMERALGGLRNGVTKAPAGMMGRVAMGGAAEAAPEFAQGGQEKYASNVAQAGQGLDVDPWSGVVAQGTMEAAAGFAPGAISGIPAPKVVADKIRAENLVPETGPLGRAANAGTEARAQAVEQTGIDPLQPAVTEQSPQPETIDDPIVDRINQIPDEADRNAAARHYKTLGNQKLAKGIAKANQLRFDALMAKHGLSLDDAETAKSAEQIAPQPEAAEQVNPVVNESLTTAAPAADQLPDATKMVPDQVAQDLNMVPDVIGRQMGENPNAPYSIWSEAKKALEANGLTGTHEIVPATAMDKNLSGFLIARRAAEPAAANAAIGSEVSNRAASRVKGPKNNNLRPEDVTQGFPWHSNEDRQSVFKKVISGLEQGGNYQDLGIDFGADDHELTVVQNGKTFTWLGDLATYRAMKSGRMDPPFLIKQLKQRYKETYGETYKPENTIEASKAKVLPQNPAAQDVALTNEGKTKPAEAAPVQGQAITSESTEPVTQPATSGVPEAGAGGSRPPQAANVEAADTTAKRVDETPENEQAHPKSDADRWQALPVSEREALAQKIGRKGAFATKLAENQWGKLTPGIQAKLREAMGPEEVKPEAESKEPKDEAKANEFVNAPDGGLDFGEITPEMGKAMRRQPGKIRLQKGDSSFGLAHIEARHGDEIRAAGFSSIEDFVSGAVDDIEAVWRPAATSQLVIIQATERGKVVFIQLQAGKDDAGDFYAVNTAFPASRTYAQKRKGWEKLWSRVPVPASDVGASDPSAELGNKADSKDAMVSSQSAASVSAKPVSGKPAKIEDSGEVLEGARKLYAKSYAAKLDEGKGMDLAAVPLSKSWPEPDYQRLIDEGVNPWAVALARSVRDEIPNKPTKGWKLKGWVQKVELARDMAAKVMAGDITKDQFMAEGGRHNLADWFNKIDLYEAVGHANSLKTLRFSEGEYSFYGGQKFSPAKKLWTINMPSTSASATWSNGNWGNDLVAADTKAEAIEKFKAWTAEQEDKAQDKPASKRTEFDVYRYRNNPKVWIVGKRISSLKSIDLKEFESSSEAQKFIVDNQAELEKLLAEAKVEQPERREENSPRVGDDHRNGADVTTEQFRETFGFRGEQFGASMPQTERQTNMNQAYDALMDLAGVIGIPPKALSLNGELGLAFGARGRGGKNPAMAHYEPDTTGAVTPNRVVINLTRKNGAGSLAHEWFHAVDNYFARMRGEKAGMLTESYPAKREGVRPEMVEAFKKVMMAIQSTGVRERSKNMDKKRTKDYWSTGLEMAARSFESYIIAKLQDKSGSNDYLANIVPESLWLQQESYPYPTMGELPAIRTAFDNFFATVQTKETDKGVAMFSRRTASGNALPDTIIGHRLGALNDHKDNAAAKAGDEVAALRLAKELVDAQMVKAVKDAAGDAPIFVPVVSVEATGKNKIPLAVSEVLASKLGASTTTEIVQVDSPKRTAMDGLDRLLTPPEFDGEVIPGASYVLVDDTITQGGTFAALASHILDNGGKISAVVALTGKQYSAKIQPSTELLNQVREQYGDIESDFRAATGYGFDALTQSEVRYLAKHNNAESVRNRIIEAGRKAGQQPNQGNAGFARNPLNPFRGIEVETAQSVVDEIASRWTNAPEIVVVADLQDAKVPEAVRNEDAKQRSQGASGEPEGFWYEGKAYIVAAAINTPQDVARVLFHETLGHYGLRGTFGESLTPILKQLAALRRPLVAAKAKQYGLDMKVEADRLQAAEEVLAEMAQSKPEMGYVKRAIAAIRAFLRKNVPGFQKMALTDADINANYILPARKFVERGPGGGPKGGVSFSRTESNDPLSVLSQTDDLFSMPKSGGKTIAEIIQDHDPEITVKEVKIPGNETFYNLTMADGTTARITVRKSGPNSVYDSAADGDNNSSFESGRPGENPEDVDPYAEDVWIDVSRLKPGQNGIRVYSIASTFAHNTGRIFIGDPNGLSDEAMRRRAENMLSSALKFGTTKHLAPHPRQTVGGVGVPALKWVYGDDVGNIERLIDLNLKALDNADPYAKQLAYDLDTGTFSDARTGRQIARSQLAASATDPRGRSGASEVSQAGWRTLARGAVFRAILGRGGAQGNGAGRPGSGGRVLDGLVRQREKLASPTKDERVFYSRSTDGNSNTRDVNRGIGATELAGQVRDKLNETFNHPGKLSWWHKTVGSQYNLAERNPAFKKVFDAAQDFINDVSYYATEAANMAPKILPKLETLRDLTKTAISAADNKAVAAPVFEGTLSWARDADGKAIRIEALEKRYENLTDDQKAQMLLRKNVVSEAQLKAWKGSKLDVYQGAIRNRFESTFLKAGVRWTDAELKSIFKLTDDQIGLYKEFRSATDASLDNMAKAQMLREAGKDVEGMRDAVMEAPDVDTAAMMLREVLLDMAKDDPERADILTDAAAGVLATAAKINDLKKQGYAPLSRFGRFTVDVVVDGQRQYFGLFESEAESNKMAAKMRMEFGADNVAQGTMSQKEFELFQGITPESLELFGNMMGLDSTGNEAQDKAFQTYLKLTKNNRSAMKRLIHRQGIAGYSEDVGRVLAAFVYANARQTAAALHIGQMDEAITAIPKGQGELKDHALELAKYIKEPREEAAALRGLMFAQYLGGSVASAMVNFTQPLTVSIPYLSQFGGLAKAGKAWAQAVRDMSKGTKLEPGLERALKDAEESGVVSPQEVHQLMAQARGAATLQSGDGTKLGDAKAKVANGWTRTALGWGKLFGYAEQVNRRSTFIAAYRMAVDQKMPNPGAFAEKAVNETQFVNNKANKMKFGRGVIGATLMTFKSYSINWLELMHRLSTQDGKEGKLAAAYMLGALFLVAGAGGLPFAGDAEDLIDAIAQKMGYNFSTKKAKQEFLESVFGKAGAQFVDRGLTGLPGVPIDVSGRMGMSNLLPGTGLMLEKKDHTSDMMELAGPAGDMAKRFFEAVGQLAKGDVGAAIESAAPKAVGNMIKGADMLDKGMYRDTKGAKVIDTTTGEAVAKMIGFQPASVSQVQESNYINQRAKDFYNLKTQEIRAKWAMGIFESDPDKVKEARQMMEEWNSDNPDQRMTANMPAIVKKVREMRKDKATRIADTAPKAMRAQMRQDARELADR